MKKYRLLAGMLTAVMIAVGAIVVCSRNSAAQISGCDSYLMPSLAAVFVGRSVGGAEKPNAMGTLVGAALVAVLENGLTQMGVVYYVLPAVKGGVLALALVAAYGPRRRTAHSTLEGRRHWMELDYGIERRLAQCAPELHSRYRDCVVISQRMLCRYENYFPDFTDHTVLHTLDILELCNQLIGSQLEQLTGGGSLCAADGGAVPRCGHGGIRGGL